MARLKLFSRQDKKVLRELNASIYPTGIRQRPISLSKTEMDAALEYSAEYINAIFKKQGQIMPFHLIYGDGSIHNPLNRQQTEALYNEIVGKIQDHDKYNKD